MSFLASIVSLFLLLHCFCYALRVLFLVLCHLLGVLICLGVFNGSDSFLWLLWLVSVLGSSV